MHSVCAFGRHAAPARALAPRTTRRQPVRVCANLCPYSTLGVNSNASDTEIKQAYRKLVLQYHPDVNAGPNADVKFMSIQQAYELLTGKSRGPQGPDGRRSDWAFHDWFWSFTQKRRWSSYKKGTAGATGAVAADAAAGAAFGGGPGIPPHKQPEHQATLRSQLAGLRHRAAIRARKQRNRPAAASTDAQDDHAQPDSSSGPEASQSGPGLEYDSSEMSDGCNMASGITDWEAAEAEHAAAAARRRFSATESHKQQVMHQMAGLHRRAAVNQEANVW